VKPQVPERVRAPDFVEPIIGYRQWRLSGGTLNSLFSDAQWTRPTMRANCPVGDHDPAITPSNGCSCGIYAYYEPCPRTASAATRDMVGGVIVVWGRIELHATGLRAEHGRVVGLELPLSRGRKRREVLEVAARLNIPAVPHHRLKAVGAEHGLPLERAQRPPRSRVTERPYQQVGLLPRATAALLRAARDRPLRDAGA
jgi:hypothetical protein